MDLALFALVAAAAVGMIAVLEILRRERHEAEAIVGDMDARSFAVSTEGMKRCPYCGMGNLVSDRTCASCKKLLPA
jgi:hypothetical protein